MSSNVPYPVSDNRPFAEDQTGHLRNDLSYMSGPDQALYSQHEYSKHPVYRHYESPSNTTGVSEPQSSLSNVLGHGGVTPTGLPSTGAQNESAGMFFLLFQIITDKVTIIQVIIRFIPRILCTMCTNRQMHLSRALPFSDRLAHLSYTRHYRP